jgi:hypothetical protein
MLIKLVLINFSKHLENQLYQGVNSLLTMCEGIDETSAVT